MYVRDSAYSLNSFFRYHHCHWYWLLLLLLARYIHSDLCHVISFNYNLIFAGNKHVWKIAENSTSLPMWPSLLWDNTRTAKNTAVSRQQYQIVVVDMRNSRICFWAVDGVVPNPIIVIMCPMLWVSVCGRAYHFTNFYDKNMLCYSGAQSIWRHEANYYAEKVHCESRKSYARERDGITFISRKFNYCRWIVSPKCSSSSINANVYSCENIIRISKWTKIVSEYSQSHSATNMVEGHWAGDTSFVFTGHVKLIEKLDIAMCPIPVKLHCSVPK